MATQTQIAARVDFACALIEAALPHSTIVTQIMGKFKTSRASAYEDIHKAEEALKGTDDGAPRATAGDLDIESHVRLSLHYALECQAVGDVLGASRHYASVARLARMSGLVCPDR